MSDEKKCKVPDPPTCPHCKTVMDKFDARELDWGTPFLWVCFNEECAFYVKGWKHMEDNFGQSVSYRYMVEPESGTVGVIPAFGAAYMARQLGKGDPYPEDS